MLQGLDQRSKMEVVPKMASRRGSNARLILQRVFAGAARRIKIQNAFWKFCLTRFTGRSSKTMTFD